jgi:hypothetical protein
MSRQYEDGMTVGKTGKPIKRKEIIHNDKNAVLLTLPGFSQVSHSLTL